jgi:hypothetical protein
MSMPVYVTDENPSPRGTHRRQRVSRRISQLCHDDGEARERNDGATTSSGFPDVSPLLPSAVLCEIWSDKLSHKVRAFSESSGTVGRGTRGPRLLG